MGYRFNPLPWRFDRVDGGSPSPDVETLTGNTGGAVGPDGSFNINLLGTGNISVAGNPGTNTLTISQTGPTWECGTGQTVDVASADLVTIDLGATPAAYSFRAIVTGKAATASAVGGQLIATFKTDGASATLEDTVDRTFNSALALAGENFTFVASGNNVILRVTGSLGSIINWNGCVEYISVTGGI